MATAPAEAAKTGETGKLDDVLLAMDVVDTLRRREQLVLRELDEAGREQELIGRLKQIYKAQGIDVPDRILHDGVEALKEKRFVYEPPAPSFQVSLAKLYVTRAAWGKPVAGILAVLAVVGVLYEYGVAQPGEAREERARIELTQTLPSELNAERDKALAMAEEEKARMLAQSLYQDGTGALEKQDRAGARQAIEDLKLLQKDLSTAYTVTVVSRPGALSGVFRIPDDVRGARNYYLIVEAIDARGRAVPVTITSEEDQKTARVRQWGQRVSEAVFNRIAADKRDDQIIQNAVIGRKPAGRLTPVYSVDTPGGAILEW